jgi:6-phospho-beta-glucosidase
LKEYFMKIAVIGGGSTYTPELIQGFINRKDSLPVSELVLMDVDSDRLSVVGGFARRIVENKGNPFKVTLSTDQRDAIRGCSYVITQLRVGMMKARREDEYLGLRHGLIGQETTGIGGLAKALRTIPVVLSVAKDIRETTDGAMLANFTNPSGLVTQALALYAGDVNAVGVCNAPYNAQMDFLASLEKAMGQKIDPARTQLNTLGLNHLTWHRGFTLDGEDVWNQVLKSYIEEQRESDEPEFDPTLVEALHMVPNYYLGYYYSTGHKLDLQKTWPPSRAEEVMEVEKDLLREYADPTLTEPPDDLMKRGGAYYSTVATQLLNAHYNDLGETHIVNTRQNGAIPTYPSDWVMELPCKIDRQGAHPLPAQPLAPAVFGLVAQVKSYELLAVEAAIHGDRKALYQAILAHPLGPDAEQVQTVMDDLLLTNKAHLPQFWK